MVFHGIFTMLLKSTSLTQIRSFLDMIVDHVVTLMSLVAWFVGSAYGAYCGLLLLWVKAQGRATQPYSADKVS